MVLWPLPRLNNCPKPSTNRFDGLTVLVVAASTGLGLEAAKKLAARGVSKLIITARNQKKGAAAVQAIETHLTSLHVEPSINIIPISLEMADAHSVGAFVSEVKRYTDHIDHAIINAGVIQALHQRCTTGFELSLQVNAISPSYLGLSLLPLMLASPLIRRPSVEERPHLTFISSSAAWLFDVSTVPGLTGCTRPFRSLSKRENFPPGSMGGSNQYRYTKLMLEYSVRHIACLQSINDSSNHDPLVMVSTVCPGMVITGIGRQYDSAFHQVVQRLLKFVHRTPDQGSNIYISSLSLGRSCQGEMWMDDQVLSGDKIQNVHSEEGKKVSEYAWAELKSVMEKMDEVCGQEVVARMLDGDMSTMRQDTMLEEK